MDDITKENVIKELETEIAFLKRTNKGIRRSLEELSLLQHMFKGISQSKSTNLIIAQFISIIKSYWKYEGYVYYSLLPEDLTFAPTQFDSSTDNDIQKNFDLNQSILTWILNEKQISTLPPSSDHINPNTCLLLIPFFTLSKLLGVIAIQVNMNADDLLTVQTLEILNLAAGYSSTSIENSILYQDLYNQNKNLEEMRAFTGNILESLVNGIITFNMNHEISHLNNNAAVMFGITEPDPVGKNYLDVLPNSLAELVHLLFTQTEKDGFVMDYQIEFELSGGVKLPYGISTSLLRDESFKQLGMILIARDMTASRELDRLRDLDKLKNDFVSTVSHELRSPLATIRAYIDTLINRVDPGDVETRTMFLATIETETARLSTLVENMLDIASIESGKIQLELEYMSINEVIEPTSKLCGMQSKNHKIILEMDTNVPKLNLDKNRMTQVLHNIVNNAIKYSPNGGNITIKSYEDQAAVRVDVTDQGIGIKPDDLKMVMQKFYRVNSQQTSNIGGTGLGLAITKKLVELHGGKIEIASEYGVGSTFSIVLPIK
ncbi:MAG: alkaline phosphatase synthesis sensor protein PhoR [uncultured bacterium]|nr:MAG: alkaline phosphatase synthesis sensor protein PhoR [uncultured bacterium]